jgi:phosphotransferase system IIB component
MAKEELTLNQIAKEIYDGAGGMENVQSVVHCMTRVRMSVRDDSKVDQSKLKSIPGVLGVVDDEQLQVIIGPGKVNKVAKEMVDMAGVSLGEELPQGSGKDKVNAKAAEMKAAQKAKQKKSPFKAVLKDPGICWFRVSRRCGSDHGQSDHRWNVGCGYLAAVCRCLEHSEKWDVQLLSNLYRGQCSTSLWSKPNTWRGYRSGRAIDRNES